MQKDGEPSVEDILRSIKKVISREDDGQAPRGIGTQVGYTPTFAGSRAFGQRDTFARDPQDRAGAAAAEDERAAPVEPTPGDDVYDLGELADEAPLTAPEDGVGELDDAPVTPPATFAAARPEPVARPPHADRVLEAPPSTAEPAPAASAAGPSVDEGLVAGAAAAAMRDQLAALSTLTARAAQPETPAHPLEDLVRDMLRPLLKDWLDQNLQGIVERSVQAEIARISGRG